MPVEVARLSAATLVADAVMMPEITPLLGAARERGLGIVRGYEMLLHQIPGMAAFFALARQPAAAGNEESGNAKWLHIFHENWFF